MDKPGWWTTLVQCPPRREKVRSLYPLGVGHPPIFLTTCEKWCKKKCGPSGGGGALETLRTGPGGYFLLKKKKKERKECAPQPLNAPKKRKKPKNSFNLFRVASGQRGALLPEAPGRRSSMPSTSDAARDLLRWEAGPGGGQALMTG